MLKFKNINNNQIHETAIVDWDNVTLGEGNIIFPYACIGTDAQHPREKSDGPVNIGNNNTFREYVTNHRPTKISRETKIGNNNTFMVNSHIGHDCILEDNITLSNSVNIAGHVYIMKNAIFGLNSSVHQFQVIGSFSMIGMNSVIGAKQKVSPGYTYIGNPAKGIIKNSIGLERNNISNDILLDECKRFDEIYNKQVKL